MSIPPGYTQLTFHYIHGQTEAFNIPVSPEEFQQQMQSVLEKPLFTLHLRDQTVVIRTAEVIKVEIKPPLSQLEGEGVFPNSERVTALTRSGR
ncbi:hypothetical protein H6S82_19180 [Planktothrix sp. FACHB-1355]|uniref:Uncharacterized protein n=1 Tax=Aerosakkonema funiforme FACHB-1375 TaxID=2949571 RepID=A0A926VGH1_9CYAN|nr:MULTISPECIES: hypothetical protein [Oscillatoriales]MBD2183283.1 hypothetical protein [Aerosakkonema funiforme FACHB-1375]MBD3560957.1 hypothetical protein [Planktothrix sp. FACHB-1355]